MNTLNIAIKNKTNLTLQLEKKYDVTYYKKQTFFSKVLLKENKYPDIYFHRGPLSSESVILLENSKLVIVSSHKSKREIIDKVSNIDKNKIHVLYPYVIKDREYEKSTKKEFKKEYGIGKGTKIVFFRGDNLIKCGINILKDTISRMYENDFVLIIESNLKQINSLKLQINRSNLNFKYLLFSDYKDISDLFISSDIFILPTQQKYFALDVLKAMYYKNAVFTMESNPASELIDVFSFIQGEEDRSISFKVDSLLINKEELKKIQKENHEIAKEYSLENNFKIISKLIKQYFDI